MNGMIAKLHLASLPQNMISFCCKKNLMSFFDICFECMKMSITKPILFDMNMVTSYVFFLFYILIQTQNYWYKKMTQKSMKPLFTCEDVTCSMTAIPLSTSPSSVSTETSLDCDLDLPGDTSGSLRLLSCLLSL